MKNIFRKSIPALLVLGILIMSLVPQLVLAQQQSTVLSEVSKSVCLPLPGFFSLIGCISAALAFAVYVAFIFLGWLVGVAGNALNFVLGMAINNKFYVAVGPIIDGWEFTRDITNIFFIFSLLFIAIATILGLESYGAKKLLARLIIIALLVNFSLLATQAIIFVTNAIAFELYSAISVTKNSWLLGSSERGFDKDLTGALMQGLVDQKIFNSDPRTLIVGPVAGQPTSSSRANTNIAVLVTLLGGSIILILAGFVFLAGAFFFAVRMVMLWLLMILAPFGFVFLILPATQEYAKKWWATLQSQALFAPAFLFFFLITVKMSQSDLLKLLQKTRTNTTTELLFLLIVQNLVILLLLGAGLLVAKQLGIYGADGAMKMAQKGGAWARGYAGRIGKRTALTATSPLAERVATSRVGRIPIIGGISRTVASAGRKSIDDYQKEIEKYNTRELKNMVGGPRIRPVQSAAIMQELVKRGDVSLEGSLTESKLRGTHSEMQRLGMNTRDLERLWPGLAVTEQQAGDVQRRSPIERMEQMNIEGTPENRIREAARRVRPADIEKLDVSVARQPYSMEAIAASASAGINQKFVERGGEHFDGLETAYRRMATAFAASRGRIITEAEVAYEDVAEALEHVGNRAGANFMRRGQGRLAFGFQQNPVIVGPPRPPRETPTGGGNTPQGNTPAQRRWIGDEYE